MKLIVCLRDRDLHLSQAARPLRHPIQINLDVLQTKTYLQKNLSRLCNDTREVSKKNQEVFTS